MGPGGRRSRAGAGKCAGGRRWVRTCGRSVTHLSPEAGKGRVGSAGQWRWRSLDGVAQADEQIGKGVLRPKYSNMVWTQKPLATTLYENRENQ
jgi:hypothetical protein